MYYRMIYIGTTFAIFSCLGTTPVSNDIHVMMMFESGAHTISMVSFNNFVDISSWPELNLNFNLCAVCMTVFSDMGPRYILCTTDSGK